MKHITQRITEITYGGIAGTDTAFVLFFLAVEYGRAVAMFSIDGLLTGVTMLMLLTLPFLLPSRFEKPAFSDWMIGRGSLAFAGILLGAALRQSTGTLLPEAMRFLPMTLLILASMVSCYIQFYGLLRLRLAK